MSFITEIGSVQELLDNYVWLLRLSDFVATLPKFINLLTGSQER